MSLNLTAPVFSPTLATEFDTFAKRYAAYASNYGMESRVQVSLQAHFIGLGIDTGRNTFRHYIPKGVEKEEHIANFLTKYRTDVLTELGLNIVRQGPLLFIYDSTHILAVGELSGYNPAFRTVTWYGHSGLIAHLKEKLDEDGRNRIPVMNRLFTSDRSVLEAPITLPDFVASPDERITYPFLDQTAAELWDAFAASSSNVMILIGPPGTGKSSLIRGMLDHRGWDDNAYLADSTNTIIHPGFVEHIRNLPSGSVVVTEDSDQLLESRENGNTAMATLLNATSGLASTDTKFLIGTNLSSLNKSDEAILRRGRLFKVLAFRKLTLEEAAKVRSIMGKDEVDLSVLGNSISLADALNYECTGNVEPLQNAIGFR